jgi:hypothetical protein
MVIPGQEAWNPVVKFGAAGVPQQQASGGVQRRDVEKPAATRLVLFT